MLLKKKQVMLGVSALLLLCSILGVVYVSTLSSQQEVTRLISDRLPSNTFLTQAITNAQSNPPVVDIISGSDIPLTSTESSPSDNLRGNIGKSIPFNTLVQGAGNGDRTFEPSLYVVQTNTQRIALDSWLDPGDRKALNSVDLTQNVVIAVFRYLGSTGEFSEHPISILSIKIINNVLDITIKYASPKGTHMLSVVTYPYHLVQMKYNTTHHPTRYRLHDISNKLIEEGIVDWQPMITLTSSQYP